MTFEEYIEDRIESALEEAREEGRKQGIAEARAEARAKAREEGRIEGRREGRIEGIQEGIKKALNLVDILYNKFEIYDLSWLTPLVPQHFDDVVLLANTINDKVEFEKQINNLIQTM